MLPTLTRYEIELDMLERNPTLSDEQALGLLRSEFQLALNASHFSAVSAEDMTVAVVSRSIPQEGVARYGLSLEFAEGAAGDDGEHAVALLRSEFQRAFNASYFWRMSSEDFSINIVSRELLRPRLTLRAA